MRRRLIHAMLAVATTLAAAGLPAVAEGMRETAIQNTIRGQVEAFQRNDAAGAYALASPTIQELFGSPAHFMAMVRQGYPQVYRPREFRFGKLEMLEGRWQQRVLVTGPDGAIVTAVYEMVEIDGRWRINGCVLLKAGDEA